MKFFQSLATGFFVTFIFTGQLTALTQPAAGQQAAAFSLRRFLRVPDFQALPPADGAAITALDKKASNGIVSIYGIKPAFFGGAQVSGDAQLLRGADLGKQTEISQTFDTTAGTGFFVSPDGYILTNDHVVADADANYSVELSNGAKKTATVVSRDPDHDLALIKISGGDFPVLPLADSANIQQGQVVVGIGTAFGEYKNTPSVGTVLYLRRTIIANSERSAKKLSGVIQTSAPLYPGDSGGPLLDQNGAVVGVDVAISANEDTISYAVPINQAKAMIADYAK